MSDTPVSLDMLLAALDYSPDLVVLANLAGEARYINAAGERVLGFTREFLRSVQFGELIHPEDQAASFEALRLAGDPSREANRHVMRVRNANGLYRWLEWRTRRIPDQDLLVCVGRDVTDAYAGMAPGWENHFTPAWLANTFDGVAVIRPDGVIQFVSQAFARLLGADPAKLRGRPLVDLAITSDRQRLSDFLQEGAQFDLVEPRSFRLSANGIGERILELALTRLPGDGGGPHLLLNFHDITDRQETAAALEQSEQRLRLALEASSGGTWLWDFATNRVSWDGFAHPSFPMRGTRFSVSFEELSAGIFAADRSTVEQALHAARVDGKPFSLEYRVVTPDGRIRTLYDAGRTVRDRRGEVHAMTGVVWDVTDFLRTKDELNETLRRLSLHFENTPLALLEWDRDLRAIRWSHQAETIFGFKAEEILGRPWTELNFVHPDDQARVADVVRQLLNGEKLYNVCENRNLTKSGELRHCVWFNSVLFDEQGRLLSVMSFAEDVTSRVEAEAEVRRHQNELEDRVRDRTAELLVANERLASSELLLRSVFGVVPYLVAVFDAAGTCRHLFSNRGFGLVDPLQADKQKPAGPLVQQTITIPGEEDELLEEEAFERLRCTDGIVGQSLFQLLPGPLGARLRLQVAEVIERGQSLEFEYQLHLERSLVHIAAQLIPFDTADGRQVLWVSRDVTAERQAATKIRQLTSDLERSSRLTMTGEMAAGIAHELHQPLMVIANYANGCRLRLEAQRLDPAELREAVQAIADEALRAGEIIRRIKTFVQRQDSQPRPVSVQKLIDSSLELTRLKATEQGLPVAVVPPERNVFVLGDELQLTQVVSHLLLNAIEAASARVPGQRIVELLASLSDARTLRLDITDNGDGIRDEDRGRVFDQFFTTKSGGLGLGLAMNKSIIEAHGGQMSFHRTADQKTVFRVTLPLLLRPQGLIGGVAPSKPDDAVPRSPRP